MYLSGMRHFLICSSFSTLVYWIWIIRLKSNCEFPSPPLFWSVVPALRCVCSWLRLLMDSLGLRYITASIRPMGTCSSCLIAKRFPDLADPPLSANGRSQTPIVPPISMASVLGTNPPPPSLSLLSLSLSFFYFFLFYFFFSLNLEF